ncbi:hypothetical protein Q7P35_006694 [Cladosporium inversicolor]
MDGFEYNGSPARVLFGSGYKKHLPQELERLSLHRPMLLSDPGQQRKATELAKILQDASIEIACKFLEAAMHTPTNVTDNAVEHAKRSNADSIVSVGGGSAIGLGKAVSIRTGLPHIALPTTYAGSEMTPILGETESGRKTTRSDPALRPRVVIYDVSYTLDLPPEMSAVSGVNAIAHAGKYSAIDLRVKNPNADSIRAVEALYARDANPIINLLALEGIASLAKALPTLVDNPRNIEARLEAQYGAWLCGTCLGSVGMSLHHKLCHTLGGSFNLPHAQTHAIVLPHAVAYNAPTIAGVLPKLAAVLPGSEGSVVRGLNILLGKLRITRGLSSFGMEESDVEKAAAIAVDQAYWNPRAVEKEKLVEVIRRCWAGEEARSDL